MLSARAIMPNSGDILVVLFAQIDPTHLVNWDVGADMICNVVGGGTRAG